MKPKIGNEEQELHYNKQGIFKKMTLFVGSNSLNHD